MTIASQNDSPNAPSHGPKRVAVTGTTGRLGGALLKRWSGPDPAGLAVVALDRALLPLDRPDDIPAALADVEFDALVHCAAMTSVDECEREPDLTHRVNALAPAALAEECRRRGARMLHVSTDYVFAGAETGLRIESDPCQPLSVYGRAKLAAERSVLDLLPDAIVARVSWVFGPEKPSFIEQLLGHAATQAEVAAIADKWSAPAYTADLADWLLALLRHPDASGVVHACNRGSCSWHELGQFALDTATELGAGLQARTVAPLSLADFPQFIAPRPIHTAMATDRLAALLGIEVPDWRDAVRRHLIDLKKSGTSFLFSGGSIG